MWYVYFLQLSNGDIYVGSTNDLKRRFSSHRAGYVLSTKAYLPVVLISYVAVKTEEHARELEVYFKSGSGKAIALKRLVRRNWSWRFGGGDSTELPLRPIVNSYPDDPDGQCREFSMYRLPAIAAAVSVMWFAT